MKGKNKFIVVSLFLINLLMWIVTLIPHHHHLNGVICLRQDIPAEQQCPVRHAPYHHPENDSCCHDECVTRFQSPSPTLQSPHAPEFILLKTLFTDALIERLLRPQGQRFKNYYIYRESLHDTRFSRASSLRAPPCARLS